MSKKTRFLSMALSMGLALSAFAGGAVAEEGGNFNATGMPIVNEKVVQKVVFSSDPVYTTDLGPEMYFFKEMEKRTNVNFEFEKLSPDQWQERKNLMFAANELPDVLMGGLSNGDVITYSQAGQLLPINDLVDRYMPDYKAVLERFPESAKLYAPDGKMYGIVNTITGGSAETPGARAFINKAWLDKLGVAMPTTYEEFYNALVAMRDGDPDGNGENDTIPLSGYQTVSGSSAGGYTVDCFVAGPLGISFSNAKDMWQVVDGKLVFVAEHPNYKQYVANMNKLYTEGLLDNEYYTQNDAQMKAKGEAMRIGAYTYAAHFVLTGSTDPAVYDQYVVPEPLTSDVFTEKAWYGENVGGTSIFFTSANKNPEISARYFNEIYNEEGATLLVGPVKGEWDGEGGRVWNDDKSRFQYEIPEGYNGVWDWICKQIAPVQSFQGFMQFSDVKAQEIKTPEDASFKDAMEKNVAPYLKPGAPTLFFTQEESEEIRLIEASLYTYFIQMESKMVMGEEPLEAYDAMMTELKNQGLDQVAKIYNAAYERYKASQA
jgi:putative aldouronate transport system substrate-binding protein